MLTKYGKVIPKNEQGIILSEQSITENKKTEKVVNYPS